MTAADTRSIYVLRLRAKPGVDGIKALRAVLKLLGRRFGLQAISVHEACEERSS